MDPDLGLLRHKASSFANNEGREGSAGDEVAPVLCRMVVEERRLCTTPIVSVTAVVETVLLPLGSGSGYDY